MFCSNMKNSAATEQIPHSSRRGEENPGFATTSKYESLEQRDREIAKAGVFRKSLYDYDVEEAATHTYGRLTSQPVKPTGH